MFRGGRFGIDEAAAILKALSCPLEEYKRSQECYQIKLHAIHGCDLK